MSHTKRNITAQLTRQRPIAVFISALASVFISVGSSGCLEVAEERAALEARIGRVELDQVTVHIEGGLAAIRDAKQEAERLELTLWAQAPSLEVHITQRLASAVKLDLTVRNVMSGVTLHHITEPRSDPAGLPIALMELSPTRFSAEVMLNTGEHTLSLSPPLPEDSSSWRFGLFADVQERLPEIDTLLAPMGKENLQFALISGDLTERGSPEVLITFQRALEDHLPFPCYATLGNHELGTQGANGPPFYELFGRGNFSFDYGGVRFTLLDSASATIAPQARTRLREWLAMGRDRLHVVAMHIPILDPNGTRGGAFASRREAVSLLSQFNEAKIDLLLYGHVHTYKRFIQAGISTIISGGGGSIPMRFDGVGRHYVRFEVDESRSTISETLRAVSPP